MNSYRKIAVSIIFISLAFSCDKGFKAVNIDPNRIQEISPGSLLNEIIYNTTSNNASEYINITSRLMQVQIVYPEFYGGVQRYEIHSSTGTPIWNANYKWAKNIAEMLKVSRQDSANNYVAVALTLKAWVYSNLTDCFGNIPFSDASKGDEGVFQPPYDNQETIYKQLVADLEEANTLYNTTAGMLYGTDILFNNNVGLWQKFTNSLRLRLLLRMSGADPDAIQQMVEIINHPDKYPVFDSFDAQAVLQVTGEDPNLSPWPRKLDLTSMRAAASFFVDVLNDFNDPRREKLLDQATKNGVQIGYKGIPAGYDEPSFDYSPSDLNTDQVVAPMIIPILTYAEVELIKAELAQKGYIPDAEQHYKLGVNAAIRLWTGADAPAGYFDNPKAAYDGTLERIITQKYVALYFTDYQQWDEYRRLGLPKLPATASMLNDGKVPSRLSYPSDQLIYNPKNYRDALSNMGGTDDINAKVWWDVQ